MLLSKCCSHVPGPTNKTCPSCKVSLNIKNHRCISSGESGDRDQLKLTDMSCISSKRYEKSHTRQNAITEGIVKMIIKDLQPAYAVEREGFQELIALLEP